MWIFSKKNVFIINKFLFFKIVSISPEIIVAFITGVLGPISIMFVKNYLDKRKKKPDLVQETLKVSELITSKIEHIKEEFKADRVWITQFHIPVNLFSKSINQLLENDIIEIPDFKDESISTFGLKYIAEESGCKSGYLFAIKSIDDKFIGTLGIDYTKRKTKLDMESINHLQVHATALGGVLMTHLSK